MKKNLVSILLALVLLASYMPVGTFAESPAVAQKAPLEELISIHECEQDIEALKKLDTLSEDVMTPDASTRTISGKISFPDGVTAKSTDIVKVYAYPARVVDNGRLTYMYDDAVSEVFVTMSQGSGSANYSIPVPEGAYNIAARFYSGKKEISGAMVYYSEDGTTFNENLSSPVNASSDVTGINLVLKKADTYLSGTIDLSANIPAKDTYVYVALDNQTNAFYNYCYAYIPVKAGQESAYYEIGLNSELGRLRFGSDYFKSRYYTNGKLTNDYNKYDAIDTTKSTDNLNVAISPYNADVDSQFSYTINFSETYDYPKTYYVSLKKLTDEENWDYYAEEWLYVPANTQSISSSMYYSSKPDGDICFTYRDITGCDSIYLDTDKSTRFYSEKLGITGSMTSATNIAGLDNLTVTEPDYTQVKGSLDLGGNDFNDYRYVYVGAQFKEESFCDRILISDKDFNISVPSRLEGEDFTLFTAVDRNGTVAGDTIENKSTYTLGSGTDNIAVSYESFHSVSGTITIPVPAPEGGVTVTLSAEDESTYTESIVGTYVISPGETSVNYSVLIPAVLNADSTFLFAEIEVFEESGIAPYTETDYISSANTLNIEFLESVTISGNISLPEGDVLTEGMRIQATVRAMRNMYVYSLTSICAGKSSASYKVTVPKGVTLDQLMMIISDADADYIRNLYYDGSNFTTSPENCKMTLTSDVVIDATLEKKATISGVFKLPENSGYTSGSASLRVCAVSNTTGSTFSKYCEFDSLSGELPFSIDVSANDTFKVYMYIYNAGDANIVTHKDAYYAGTTTTTDASKASSVNSDSVIEFPFPLFELINGKISFAEGAIIEGSEGKGLDIELSLRPKSGGGKWQSKKIEDVANTNDIPFSFPVNEGETYILSAYIYNNDSIVANVPLTTYYYYNKDKSTITLSEATEFSCADTINFVIPKLNMITGKINVPNDYRYLSPVTSVSASIYRTSGNGSYSHYPTAYIDEDFNYTLTFPDTLDGTYTLNLNFNGTASNIIGENYYYHIGEESKTSFTITPGQDISGLNFDVETGYAIEGKIKLPSDAQIRNVTYTPKVYANSYHTVCTPISAENREAKFMVAVPKSTTATGTSVTLNAELTSASKSGDWYTNMYEKKVYYIPGAESSFTSTNASFNVTEDVKDISLELKTAALLNVKINRPDNLTGSLSGYVYVSDGSSNIASQSFSVSQNSSSTDVTVQISKQYIGEELYVYYVVNTQSDYIQPGKIYLNPDGTYTNLNSQRKGHKLKENQSLELTIQSPEDMVYPNYILQSDHPYKANTDKTYTYTHPDPNVTSLKVTFSEDSYMAYGASVTIYNADGTAVIKSGSNTSFTYGDLAGKTVNVSGNSFTIQFKTGSSNNSNHEFGWAVTDVEARNIIVESKHPYREALEYEYTHPTTVEKLAVTFDENSKTASYDTVYFYNEDGNIVSRLSGDLANKTIEVPGSYFKMVLNANSSTSEYGIAVTHITEAVTHNVVFLDSDGTILQEKTVYIGRPGVCDYPPKKVRATGKKIYTFTGWDCERSLVSVRSDLYARAQYAETTGYFESAHPYKLTESVYTYEYNHNTEADSLEVKFSDKTGWSFERAIFYLYDAYGNQVVSATSGSEISGKTFTVPGTKFTIEFRPLSNYNSEYGFKIDSVNGVYTTPRYTLTYVDMNGHELCTRIVKEGDTIPDPGIAVFEGYKNGVEYDFVDWERPVAVVTSDMTIRPIYNTVEYTRIYTEEDLNNVRNNLDGKYILMNDIELVNPWTPIGSLDFNGTDAFTGIFDGNKHVVRNVVISPVNDTSGTRNLAGFFTRIREAEIRDLGLEIAYGGETDSHNSALYWGGLAAESRDSHIDSCYVSGTMETSYYTPDDEDVYIGGFIGSGDNTHIFNCYSDVKITFNANSNCTDIALVTGFAAEFYNGFFESCYSNSSVTVNNKAENDEITLAGFVGYSFTPGNVVMPSSCFYNTDRFNIAPTAAETLWDIQGKTSAQLKDKKTYCSYIEEHNEYAEEWNFWEVWHLDETVNDGFPHLGFTYKVAEFKEVEASVDEEEEMITIDYELTKVPTMETTMFVTSYVDGKFAGVTSSVIDNTSKSGNVQVGYEGEKPDEVKILLWEDFWRLRPFAEKTEVTVE